MDAPLLQIVEERLDGDAPKDAAWPLLVLAACEGAEQLERTLGGSGAVDVAAPTPAKPRRASRRKGATTGAAEPEEPLGAYLRSVSVEGFRGVGARQTLNLQPGPGLTLVVGRNGSGKSTLLALLLGELPLAAGRRVVGRATVLGALDQRRVAYDGADPLLAVFTARSKLQPGEGRTLLAKFNLGADHVERPCATLSPGERTRAHLAELMARGVNCLVLDEPTNHLDVPAIETLEAALEAYDGTVVAVSHDRYFLDRIADRIVEVADGEARAYEGGFSTWEARRSAAA